jgi:IS4 transposase
MADIYKEGWPIELFIKKIWQNLRLKRFVGTSENTVCIHIYTAMTLYLLLAYQ